MLRIRLTVVARHTAVAVADAVAVAVGPDRDKCFETVLAGRRGFAIPHRAKGLWLGSLGCADLGWP